MIPDVGAFFDQLIEAHAVLWNEFLPAWVAVFLAATVLPQLGLHASFRRQTLTTIALPQCAFAGMAIALTLPIADAHGEPHPTALLIGVVVGTVAGLLVTSRFRRESATLGVAACFIASLAVTEVARALSPFGETRLEPLLHGEVLGLTAAKLPVLAFLLIPAVMTFVERRAWLATAAYPDSARAAGLSIERAALGFAGALGFAVLLATQALGPLITSGLLLLPAAFARHRGNVAGSAETEARVSGWLAAWWGPVAAVMLDIPVGPGVVAAAVVVGAVMRAVRVRNVR